MLRSKYTMIRDTPSTFPLPFHRPPDQKKRRLCGRDWLPIVLGTQTLVICARSKNDVSVFFL